MNYGQSGRELLLDLKRSDWLPAYSEDGVRTTLAEINHHTNELTDLVRAANRVNEEGGGQQQQNIRPEYRPSMILHDASIQRNKRCLLAYHAYRIDKLRSLRWETAGLLPAAMKNVLSEAEVDFFNEYDKLASRHALSSGSMANLDWNADQLPPEDAFVQVRVVQSGLGKIETETCGVVELEVGSTHYLPRGDVENLIRSGALVQLSGEETS